MKNTLAAISNITGRKALKCTEMAFVICAVFDSGRPKFISKSKIIWEVFQWDCGAVTEEFLQEWVIKPEPKPEPRLTFNFWGEHHFNHLRSAKFNGFAVVRIEGKLVLGIFADYKFNDDIKLFAKQQRGWFDSASKSWVISLSNLKDIAVVIRKVCKDLPEWLKSHGRKLDIAFDPSLSKYKDNFKSWCDKTNAKG